MRIELAGEALELLPQKAIWWPATHTLLLADTHFGKVNHFRRSGIPVPQKASDKNWELMVELIHRKKPERIICIGDLFHSHYNSEWEAFGQLTRNFESIAFDLVIGNHDILSDLQYERNGIRVYDSLQLGPFLLKHHPEENNNHAGYCLSGHVHPGVRLRGKGKQSVMLPCFYFGERQGYLPAFGAFTGLASIQPKKEDRIFAIIGNDVMAVS